MYFEATQLGFLAVMADPETPKAYSACSFQTTFYQSDVSCKKLDEFKFHLVPLSNTNCQQQAGIPVWFCWCVCFFFSCANNSKELWGEICNKRAV